MEDAFLFGEKRLARYRVDASQGVFAFWDGLTEELLSCFNALHQLRGSFTIECYDTLLRSVQAHLARNMSADIFRAPGNYGSYAGLFAVYQGVPGFLRFIEW